MGYLGLGSAEPLLWGRQAIKQSANVCRHGPSMADTQRCDIFISHRGPDSKRNFCCWLRRDLNRYGYCAFLDEEDLRCGGPAWDTIEAQLKIAKLVIVVLSENYGRSPWCLMELAAAMKRGQQVLPVFFGVSTNTEAIKVERWAPAPAT